jgi:hypothetical protein
LGYLSSIGPEPGDVRLEKTTPMETIHDTHSTAEGKGDVPGRRSTGDRGQVAERKQRGIGT